MERGMEGQVRGVWWCVCVCMNCVVVNVYGVMTGSLGKVEFNDFFISLRDKWLLVHSIPVASVEVTCAFMEVPERFPWHPQMTSAWCQRATWCGFCG